VEKKRPKKAYNEIFLKEKPFCSAATRLRRGKEGAVQEEKPAKKKRIERRGRFHLF